MFYEQEGRSFFLSDCHNVSPQTFCSKKLNNLSKSELSFQIEGLIKLYLSKFAERGDHEIVDLILQMTMKQYRILHGRIVEIIKDDSTNYLKVQTEADKWVI